MINIIYLLKKTRNFRFFVFLFAIYDLIKGRTKCSKVITVKRFCEGARMTLSEFFDKDYFNNIEED